MKKISVYFICLVMVTLFFIGCVAQNTKQKRNSPGMSSNLPPGKVAGKDFFVDLGLSAERWENEKRSSGGYIRGGFEEFIAYYFPDSEEKINCNLLISKEKMKEMNEEFFLSLVKKELKLYFRNNTILKQKNSTPLTEVTIGKIPALFVSVESHLSDGRYFQMSFAGASYKEKVIFIIYSNYELDSRKNKHTREILENIFPKIVFQDKPFDGHISFAPAKKILGNRIS